MQPCWVVQDADLTRAPLLIASVGQVPFNFQIGKDVEKIKLRASATPGRRARSPARQLRWRAHRDAAARSGGTQPGRHAIARGRAALPIRPSRPLPDVYGRSARPAVGDRLDRTGCAGALSMSVLDLRSPLSGWCMPLAEVPDPVFAGGMMGDGVAIDPTDGVLSAPCDGELISVAPSKHAVTCARVTARNCCSTSVSTRWRSMAPGSKRSCSRDSTCESATACCVSISIASRASRRAWSHR